MAATTLALGIWCVVQREQLRAGNERMRAAEEAWHAETEAREAQSTRLKELERKFLSLELPLESANERLDQPVQEFVDGDPAAVARKRRARPTILRRRMSSCERRRRTRSGKMMPHPAKARKGFLAKAWERCWGK